MPPYALFATNATGHLKVDDVHEIYWEDCGKKDGVPVVYLHGGPGGGIEDSDRYVNAPDEAILRFYFCEVNFGREKDGRRGGQLTRIRLKG